MKDIAEVFKFINYYALSKVWYKCNSIDIRVRDFNNISSKVKAWLYADQLEKPEEIVLYRPTTFGGLGLHHIEFKAKAMLTRSFLETAGNTTFLTSLYHSSLFNYHILQERLSPDPGFPPYYSPEFFSFIRYIHENSTSDVTKLSSSQWYELMIENLIKVPSDDEHTPKQYTPCRAELSNPHNDWENTWRLARLPGLGSEITTFLWRMLHKLLPTQDRVHRMVRNQNASPNCQLCDEETLENQQHAFFQCSFNANAGASLLRGLSGLVPGITSDQVLLLDIEPEAADDEHPAVWLVGHYLSSIWASRVAKKAIRLYSIRTDLEARASLLSETRFNNCGAKTKNLIQLCFSNL